MKKIFKTMLLLAAITTGTGTIVSCSSDDDLAKADALFRPIINEDDNLELGLDANNVPYMIVKWDNYTDADQYTVKVEPADASASAKEITTSDLTCRFDGLEYDKEYFVYISSANTKNGLSSKPYSLTTTTPDYPTKMQSPAATDIIDIAVAVCQNVHVNNDIAVDDLAGNALLQAVAGSSSDFRNLFQSACSYALKNGCGKADQSVFILSVL